MNSRGRLSELDLKVLYQKKVEYKCTVGPVCKGKVIICLYLGINVVSGIMPMMMMYHRHQLSKSVA